MVSQYINAKDISAKEPMLAFSSESPPLEASALSYFPQLDGLRALAVLFVLLCHSGLLIYGYLGVPVFFTLSGFLITRILLQNVQSPNYYKNFYWRRFLRIWPAYILSLLMGCLITAGQHIPFGFWQVASYSLYLQNVLAFMPGFCLPCLGHTWSLAVEEQFYFVFPWLCKRLQSKENVSRLALGFILFAPVARWLLALFSPDPNAVWLWLFCCLDTLGIGVWLACQTNLKEQVKLLSWACVLAFIVYGLAMAILHDDQPFWQFTFHSIYMKTPSGLWFMWLWPYLSGLLVAWVLVAPANTLRYKVLTLRPLAFLGKISYGIYLYHFFAVSWVSYQPTLWKYLLYFGGSIAAASVSWFVLEKKALAYKNKLPQLFFRKRLA